MRAAVAVAASARGLARAAGRDLDPRAGARVVLEQPGGSRSYLSNGSSSSHTRRRGALVLSSSTAALNCSPKPDARQARKASFWISPYGRIPVRVVLASSFWARDSSRPRPNASLGARGARRRRGAKEFATPPPQPHLRRAIQLDAGRRTHCWSCKRQRARPPRQGCGGGGGGWGRGAVGLFHTRYSLPLS